jgi:hypothetical protein
LGFGAGVWGRAGGRRGGRSGRRPRPPPSSAAAAQSGRRTAAVIWIGGSVPENSSLGFEYVPSSAPVGEYTVTSASRLLRPVPAAFLGTMARLSVAFAPASPANLFGGQAGGRAGGRHGRGAGRGGARQRGAGRSSRGPGPAGGPRPPRRTSRIYAGIPGARDPQISAGFWRARGFGRAHLKQSMSPLVPMSPWKLPDGVASVVAAAAVLPTSSGSLGGFRVSRGLGFWVFGV